MSAKSGNKSNTTNLNRSEAGRGKDSHSKHAAPVTVKNEPSSQGGIQDVLGQSQAGKGKKRKQSQSSLGGDAPSPRAPTTSDKKPRLGPSMLNDYPSQAEKVQSTATNGSSSGAGAGTSTIDDREQALKAQRKKEKNAKKKARKSGEKAA
jgi:hypothetical protein